MTTSATRPPDQTTLKYYDYDPDEGLSRRSPPMNPIKPNIAPAACPEFTTPRHIDRDRGEAVLIKYLGSCRQPDVTSSDRMPRNTTTFIYSSAPDNERRFRPPSPAPSSSVCQSPEPSIPPESPKSSEPGPLNLKFLAAGALAFSNNGGSGAPDSRSPLITAIPNTASPSPSHNGSELRRIEPVGATNSTSRLPIREDRTVLGSPTTIFSGKDRYPARPTATLVRPAEATSPTSPNQPGSGGLPPLQIDSPRSESSSHGQALPSIRQHFSDLQLSPDKDLPRLRHVSSFSRSPPPGLPGISSMTTFAGPHPTSPTSPNGGFRRDLPSPQPLGTTPYNFHPYGHGRLPGGDHCNSAAETPSSDQSSSTPANAGTDRLSIDGLTGPSQHGGYVCTFSGCTAPPFQTQYLLNSHANVHSSARPHYCPVPGCPRSEGGKGFKRKNEMIRHGLVHESPGYVCPFCPDREHKYPRPDNLQRHVRVHHVDKDKDDPLLRDVLSQRPDGPNRGRRRRGVAS